MSIRPCTSLPDLLPEDLLLEAFLRLPPEPSHLYAVSRVCRRWRGLVRWPDFLSRFRAFHRTPPVLGIFQDTNTGRYIQFVPTTGPAEELSKLCVFRNGNVLDCRHGRVLLMDYTHKKLVVWDPVDNKVEPVSLPDELMDEEIAGAVVCAAKHNDHNDCHSCPFHIIFLEWREDEVEDDEYWAWANGCVYSSQTGLWGEWTATTFPSAISSKASVLVGDCVYWTLDLSEANRNHILEFDLAEAAKDWHTIELPDDVSELYLSDIHIVPAEDGGIGCAGVNGSVIHLWSRLINSEGVAEWSMIRTINMDNFTLSGVPAGDMLCWSSIVGYAEDCNVLFLKSEAGVFMINLNSMHLKKISQATDSAIYPYSSFYARGRDVPGIDTKGRSGQLLRRRPWVKNKNSYHMAYQLLTK